MYTMSGNRQKGTRFAIGLVSTASPAHAPHAHDVIMVSSAI